MSGLAQLLRMTPRNCEGQYVVAWRLEVSPPCTLHQHDDAFGNLTHFFTAEGAASELRIAIEGVVETQDTHGVVTGALERFPPSLYLRETPLTTPDAALQAAAASIRASAGDNELDLLHRLQTKLHEEILFVPIRPIQVPARRKLSRWAAASVRTSPTFLSPSPEVPAFRPAMSAELLPIGRGNSAGSGTCLGRSVRPGPRVGWIRSHQRHFDYRCARACRHRSGLFGCRAGPRHALWWPRQIDGSRRSRAAGTPAEPILRTGA